MKILLTGGAGFLGQHIKHALLIEGAPERNITIPRSRENDLRCLEICQKIMPNHEIVIHCAVHGYGIGYNNKYPAQIFDDNATMGMNLMKAAQEVGITKFVTIGSLCEYPKNCPMPLTEEKLWDGYPEDINAPYAISKRMLLAQGEAYRRQYGFNSIHLLLSNLYGPGNSFDPLKSHVIGALIVKIVHALEHNETAIDVWGDGSSSRSFLYVEDAAKAVILATKYYNEAEPVNIGSSHSITIKDLVLLIAETLRFKGKINWDKTKPVGQMHQYIDTSRAMAFNFTTGTNIEVGLKKTIAYFYEKRISPR